jgi:hypothetical protein
MYVMISCRGKPGVINNGKYTGILISLLLWSRKVYKKLKLLLVELDEAVFLMNGCVFEGIERTISLRHAGPVNSSTRT